MLWVTVGHFFNRHKETLSSIPSTKERKKEEKEKKEKEI